jgi:hypothetical protein
MAQLATALLFANANTAVHFRFASKPDMKRLPSFPAARRSIGAGVPSI